MKNLTLLIALTLSSIAFCQTNKLEGSWSCYEQTSYITTISVNSETGLIEKVHSYSSYTGNSVTEEIIHQDSDVLKTKFYFKKDDWRVRSTFVFIDENTMKRTTSGSNEAVLIYKKVNN